MSQEDLIFRTAVTEAWFATRMEKDKSLLVLSTGAIGFLIAVITTVNSITTATFGLFCLAVFSFVMVIIFLTVIFSKNADYLESVLDDSEDKTQDEVLEDLDKFSSVFFFLGLAATAIIGLSFAFDKIEGGQRMSNDKKNNGTPTQKSLNGVSKLKPKKGKTPVTNSFQGVVSLRPTKTPSPKNKGGKSEK